jgi:PAS domain S-box-containing protein
MQEIFHRGIVEGMSCGVLTLDTDSRILTANSLARQILEIGDEPVEGRPCGEVLRHHRRLSEVLVESLRLTTLPSREELSIKTRDGGSRTIGFSISRIIGGDSEVLGLAMFFRDLTQVERQEEQARLRDRLAALGEMAAQMAHEIRNPIASIVVTSQLIRRRLVASGESTKPVSRIHHEVERIERTIASCLEYVRPISPSIGVEPLKYLLGQALDDARQRCKPAKLNVRIECEAGLGALPCDGPRIRGVFTSLIVNSIEAMEGKGEITIHASTDRWPPGALRPADGDGAAGGMERCAVIRLSDTGPGIPEELRDRVFYPFFTTKTTGTGIGLAIARKVIEAHRGMIDISGEAGKGAVFTVTLPLAATPEKARDAVRAEAPAARP